MTDLIYLASPYSDPDPEVRHRRYEAACKAVARLLQRREIVISPICHSHMLALKHDLPTEWDFWSRIDKRIIEACDRMIVLMLPGWKTSKGVRAEIGMAVARGMPVEYMEEV